MTGPFARILLRYLAGVLVARGLIDDGSVLSGDPDVLSVVETILGLLAAGASEAWFYLAKKYGWTT